MPAVPPRRAARRNRWTRTKMVEFLRALRALQSVDAAAHCVGMGRQSAYKLRARLAGSPFDEAWDLALDRPEGFW